MVSIEVVYRYALAAFSTNIPRDKEYTNSIGMRFARIEPGTFSMGFGEFQKLSANLRIDRHIPSARRFFIRARNEVERLHPRFAWISG